MKPIKIEAKKREAIEAALAAVNGRATAFTVSDYYEVHRAMVRADNRLDALPQAERAGAKATYTPAGPTAKAYKHTAKSTTLLMERRATGWFLTGVEATEVRPKQAESLTITITPAQRDEIARRAVADFRIEMEQA